MRRRPVENIVRAATLAATLALATSPAAAQGAKPLTKCAPDAVVAGTVCMDKFEASVWRVPIPFGANKGLVKKIRQGKATIADLAKGGATQLGVASDDYAPCADSGQNCANDIYAVSLPQVKPSSTLTWFQAQMACKNAAKRLPSNAEWQAAVVGTPDPGPDNGTTDCNTATGLAALTGSRSSCVSIDGAFDMVGNLYEWTADWVPRSPPGSGDWTAGLSPTFDNQGLGGAETSGEPGALLRGGAFVNQSAAGPLAVVGGFPLSRAILDFGFRCAR